jgi:hypothetical protein
MTETSRPPAVLVAEGDARVGDVGSSGDLALELGAGPLAIVLQLM